MSTNITISEQPHLVCVRCMTFNHEAYIKDALNGFVIQQTKFPFVVAIINDASTDKTKSVINDFVKINCIYNPEIDLRTEEYGTILDVTVKDNPHCMFHIVHLNENHYGKKSKLPYFAKHENAAKYVAMCEGDDYWTDPLKLQKQVDFLEANPEYSMCCNATRWLCSDGKYYDNPNFHGIVDTDITTHQVIERGGLGINLASIVYRNIDTLDRYRKSNWWSRADVGDYPLCIALSLIRKIRYMSDVMSVYRFQHPGSWTERNKNVNIKHLWNEITWMQILDEETERKYHINIEKHLFSFWRTLYREDDQVTTSQYIQKYNEAGKLISIHRLIKDIIRRFVMQIKKLLS